MRYILILIFFIVGCDTHENEYPWSGYAWNKEESKFEWFFIHKETLEDCIQAMEFAVSTPPHNAWYTTPISCGYHGNNYYKVWLMNEVWGGSHFKCIVKNTHPEIKEKKMVYGPLLEGYPSKGKDYYCQ